MYLATPIKPMTGKKPGGPDKVRSRLQGLVLTPQRQEEIETAAPAMGQLESKASKT
jgi:hypothetical protein